MILAPIVRGRKGEFKKELEKLHKDGFVRARIDGEMRQLDEEITARQAKESHDRGRRRPLADEGRRQRTAYRIGKDGTAS